MLEIDTDLMVPTELDAVVITLAGATRTTSPPDVDLTAAGAPAFPLTLGLRPSGLPSGVSVTVIGRRAGLDIVRQDVETEFVEGESLLLQVLLLSACSQFSCAAGLTCVDGACQDPHRAGACCRCGRQAPGASPARNVVTSVGGRSVWAAGGRTCAVVASCSTAGDRTPTASSASGTCRTPSRGSR